MLTLRVIMSPVQTCGWLLPQVADVPARASDLLA